MIENHNIVTKKDLLNEINSIHLKNSDGCLAKIKHKIEDEVGINDENNL